MGVSVLRTEDIGVALLIRRQSFEISLHDQKTGVWRVVTATRIVGSTYSEQTANLERYINAIFRNAFESFTEEEYNYMNDGATAHTANCLH
jgi:hypothetical protein